MNSNEQPPEIFDRRRRRAFRERAGYRKGDAFLWQHIAEDLAERLALVTRDFHSALVIGPVSRFQAILIGNRKCDVATSSLSISEATSANSQIIEEDRLPFDTGSFDLVISAGTLDSVNDLPGALVQIRRILKPDGLFLGHMFGAGTLSTLKSLMMAAEGNRAAPHIHPQIDLRSAADLLSRAGFALPVADQDIMQVRYSGWRRLVADLRDAGVGNALAGQSRYLGKSIMQRLDSEWAISVGNAVKVEENFVHVHLSGWAPSPDQPQPAKRGSGKMSLAAILQPTTKI
jgi:NADH dehydrogenase [ubiquinone] 1 alpha subcomplex assembly factor 5